jgi:hypothetical protein
MWIMVCLLNTDGENGRILVGVCAQTPSQVEMDDLRFGSAREKFFEQAALVGAVDLVDGGLNEGDQVYGLEAVGAGEGEGVEDIGYWVLGVGWALIGHSISLAMVGTGQRDGAPVAGSTVHGAVVDCDVSATARTTTNAAVAVGG